MPINILTDNPAISQFNARVAVGDQARRQEQGDFYQRMQVEQALAVDKAQREAAAAHFASPQVSVAPVQTTQFPPTVAPPATPIAAQATPMPSAAPADNPDYGGVAPRAAPAPNVTPAPAPAAPPAIAGFSAQPPAPVAPQPAASVQASPYNAMASRLAQTTGTGASMMGMVNADVTGQRAASALQSKHQHEGAQMFVEASRRGDMTSMRLINRQYGMGIPDQIINNREIAAELAAGLNIAREQFGKTDPAQAIAFAKGYMHTIGSGDRMAAINAGLAEAEKVKPTQASIADTRAGATVLSAQTRAGVAGSGGGGSKQQQYAEWRIKTLTQAGMPPDQAQQLVAGGAGTRPMTAQQRLSLAKGLMSAKGPGGINPLYKSFDEALKAIDTAVSPPQQPGQGPFVANIPDDAAAQARALELDAQGKPFDIGVGFTPTPSAATPPANAPKRMRFDASGNEIR